MGLTVAARAMAYGTQDFVNYSKQLYKQLLESYGKL